MGNIELREVINKLGQPQKRIGDEYLWQCPLCMDKSKNNLMFNIKKGVLWCFADPTHSPNILKAYFSENPTFRTKNQKAPIISPKPSANAAIKTPEELFSYMQKCNRELMQSERNLKFLFSNRGISRPTVENCKIGVDNENLRWAFPTFKYSCNGENEPVGFEYRYLNLKSKRMYREKGMTSCMAMINPYATNQKILVMVEGYLDGYALVEHLSNMKQLPFYHVITPSNGVANAFKLLSRIEHNFDKYSKIYAYLDSDDAGITQMEAIKRKYPFIETPIMRCGCKDFNEHYLKCILKGKNRTIL